MAEEIGRRHVAGNDLVIAYDDGSVDVICNASEDLHYKSVLSVKRAITRAMGQGARYSGKDSAWAAGNASVEYAMADLLGLTEWADAQAAKRGATPYV